MSLEKPEKPREGITLSDLLENYQRRLLLEVVAGMDGLPRTIHSTELHRPALALTGFVDLYTFDRGQVLGNTELLYLNSLNSQERRAALEIIYQFDLPCVIITNGYEVLPELLELSEDRGVPLLTTTLSTARFIHQFLSCLDDYFAPRTTMHGTMVDVYGVGLLLTGRSSIGKSEIALDLVERGHRLVADDVVHITRQRNILRGESSPMLGQKMEIRGIGIIDVQRLFGIRAIRKAKRVEVVLNLVQWSDEETYERIGLSHGSTCILGVEIPMIQLPIFPGKNITVIAETIAMNHLLRIDGYSAAEELNIRLSDALKQRTDGPSTYGMMEEEH